ncbi:hypothetical protein [Mesorhizobium sp. B2-3-15]|uniref:hypothetical protein n=1 Tax=Mesorhizobium sp. B2-3-15 TaxID=2589949 RepID=UPI00112AF355|nr:hypothetical protein [Mesorhizobium sp. B2-3-15]TPL72399.1 hypothetical protein FJ954_17085 [Mesorhizobium sp. B2-3-15]
MNKEYWALIRENIGSASVTVPLFSLFLSGAFFFGFFSVVGFSNIGTVGVSDFSKAALRWSPSALFLAIALAIPHLSSSGSILRDTEKLRTKIKAGAPLDEIEAGLRSIENRHHRISRFFSTLSRPRFLSKGWVVIAAILFLNIFMVYLFITSIPPNDALSVLLFFPLNFSIILYYLIVNERDDIIGYLIAVSTFPVLTANVAMSGRSTATDLLSPKERSLYTIGFKDKEIVFDSYIRFDYSIYAYSKGEGLFIYDTDNVNYIRIKYVCMDSYWTCMRHHPLINTP